MLFPQPLRRGRLVARYKRFFADVVLDELGPATAHVANSGRMLGLLDAGNACWLSPADKPGRKLVWTLEMIEERASGVLVGCNTLLPNRVAAEAIAAEEVPELAGYAGLRREVRYGENSRIDILLEHPDRPPCFVEVKNAHLRRQGRLAEFPDCVTTRGAKHLRELAAVAGQGSRAVVLFVLQRNDCEVFSAAADLDPAFAAALDGAAASGVEVLCYASEVRPEGVRLTRRLPWLGAA